MAQAGTGMSEAEQPQPETLRLFWGPGRWSPWERLGRYVNWVEPRIAVSSLG